MSDPERMRRWRLVLGGGDADATGVRLGGGDQNMDRALSALYSGEGEEGQGSGGKRGGLGDSAPNVARWLGDIRSYFPVSVVRVMQQDAIDRLNLKQLLLEPEMLESVEPDVHLVSTLVSLNSVIPTGTRETARAVVRKVVEDIQRRIQNRMLQAVNGSLARAIRNRRPRHNEIDWHRTIRANLRHYQPGYRTIVPETRIGYGRKRSSLRDVILCIDQSGSMAASVVYASVFGAVMASMPALRTHMVVFDTSVVDLTAELHDPVELLFGTQLGGGTDINRALGYCQSLIQRPSDTILILISDLYEGGNRDQMIRKAASIAASGVQMVALLALNDEGAPSYDGDTAAALAKLGIPAFACTPDQFPDLMATVINRRDVNTWAAAQGIVTSRG
jgi:Mg-chelatase subunit ChlD